MYCLITLKIFLSKCRLLYSSCATYLSVLLSAFGEVLRSISEKKKLSLPFSSVILQIFTIVICEYWRFFFTYWNDVSPRFEYADFLYTYLNDMTVVLIWFSCVVFVFKNILQAKKWRESLLLVQFAALAVAP